MPDPSLLQLQANSALCKYCESVFVVIAGRRMKFCSQRCARAGRSKPLYDRLMEKVQKTEGCWLFTGAKIRGYGTLGETKQHSGRHYYAHRVSWIMHNGPIPDGLFVLHKCDNPPCVNPEHLFLGDDEDNQRDRSWKSRGSSRIIEAFGERKPLFAWLEDSRCVVLKSTLRFRLKIGMSTEDAITRPAMTRPEQSRYANAAKARKRSAEFTV